MGHQETVEEMRAEKSEKFLELKDKKKDPEYEEWFLKYRPLDKKEVSNEEQTNKKSRKTRRKNRKTRKKRGIFF